MDSTAQTLRWAQFAAVLIAMACAERPPAPVRAGFPKPSLPTLPGPGQASAAPLASVVEPPVAEARPTTLVTRQLVTELPCDARFFVVGTRTFVACDQHLFFVDERGIIVDDTVHAAGLGLDSSDWWSPRIVSMAGQWPRAAWAVTQQAAEGGNAIDLKFFRWHKDRWVAVTKAIQLGSPFPFVVFPWGGTGLVALAPAPFEATRLLAFGAETTPVPPLTKAIQTQQQADEYPCKTAILAPEAWTELASHDILVFSGQLCGVPGGAERAFGVERLRGGQQGGELTLFPLPAEVPRAVLWHDVVAAARAPTDALVAASGIEERAGPDGPPRQFQYLAHWDGVAWHPEPASLGKLTALWAEAGAYWAIDSAGATWLRRGARWFLVEWRELPPSSAADTAWTQAQIVQLRTDAAGTLWLVRSEERPQGSYASRVYRLRFEL